MSDAAIRPDVVLIRKQSAAELVSHAAHAAVSATEPPHKSASCMTDVWFSAFFDGTSNSIYDEDPRPVEQQAYSNVARLFRSHSIRDDSKGVFALYLQGVGTKFPEIGDPGGVKGAATGYMGMERIDYAEKRLKFAIDTQRSRGLSINTVHVAVFGFSRGATLARAFVNRLAGEAKRQGAQWVQDGARFRIYFVGVFDTVASVGLPRDHNTYRRTLASRQSLSVACTWLPGTNSGSRFRSIQRVETAAIPRRRSSTFTRACIQMLAEATGLTSRGVRTRMLDYLCI